jgi:hypothetical protein
LPIDRFVQQVLCTSRRFPENVAALNYRNAPIFHSTPFPVPWTIENQARLDPPPDRIALTSWPSKSIQNLPDRDRDAVIIFLSIKRV